jgi:hypothetical protein
MVIKGGARNIFIAFISSIPQSLSKMMECLVFVGSGWDHVLCVMNILNIETKVCFINNTIRMIFISGI